MWFFICNTYLTTLHFEIQLDAFASNRYATFFSRLHLRGFFLYFYRVNEKRYIYMRTTATTPNLHRNNPGCSSVN